MYKLNMTVFWFCCTCMLGMLLLARDWNPESPEASQYKTMRHNRVCGSHPSSNNNEKDIKDVARRLLMSQCFRDFKNLTQPTQSPCLKSSVRDVPRKKMEPTYSASVHGTLDPKQVLLLDLFWRQNLGSSIPKP